MLEDDVYLARHVDVYFEHVHTTGCYGFLHEPSVREAMSEGRLSRSLALAMCAASTRFLSSTSGKTLSSWGDGAADPEGPFAGGSSDVEDFALGVHDEAVAVGVADQHGELVGADQDGDAVAVGDGVLGGFAALVLGDEVGEAFGS